MATDEHSHLARIPEPLEKLYAELDGIARVAGPEGAEDAKRIRSILEGALAAQARGAVGEAVAGIMQAMQAIAALAGRLDPREASEMGAVAEQFARALRRGDSAEARGAADRMRARAGAKVVKND